MNDGDWVEGEEFRRQVARAEKAEAELEVWKKLAIDEGCQSPGLQERSTVTLILEGRVRRALNKPKVGEIKD